MPLSNDFTNTRMSYLQDAIKNTKTVSEQFYPRFVRDYNEQFPFTEPSLSNVGNPISSTAVKGYLQPKTQEQVIEDLRTKINSLTNDEGVTNYIGIALSKQLSFPVLSYLNDNFDSIKSKIPISRDGISKDAFVNKILSVLRNDPNFNKNTTIYDDKPLISPPIQQVQSSITRFPIKKPPVLRNTILPSKSTDNHDESIGLNALFGTQNNNILFTQTNPQPKTKIKTTTTTTQGRMKNMPNVSNRDPNITLEQLKAMFSKGQNYTAETHPEEFERFKTIFFKPFEGQPTEAPVTRSQTTPRYEVSNAGKFKTRFATGIQLQPLRIQHRVIKHKQVFNNNKYAIDTKKLKKNILDLKYVKNANHVATFQPIEISNNLKNIIDNIIKDHYNLQTETFDDLNTTEKRILKRLFKFLKIQNTSLETNSNNSVQHNFEVAYGSFLAGNNNKELINELQQYIKLALHESTISKKDGYEILKKLNNK
jgi:hypothetical protein